MINDILDLAKIESGKMEVRSEDFSIRESIILTLAVASDPADPHKRAEGSLTGSHLLCATGRRPNTDELGLDKAGIETNPRGFIEVNGRLETNVPGVWALGDVNGGPAFTHISYNDFQIVYANVVEGKNLQPSTASCPTACSPTRSSAARGSPRRKRAQRATN